MFAKRHNQQRQKAAHAPLTKDEQRERSRRYYELKGRDKYLASPIGREKHERQKARIAYYNSEEYRQLKLKRLAAAIARKTKGHLYKTKVRECLFCRQTARFSPHQKYCSRQCASASQRKPPEQKKKEAVDRARAWKDANPERYRTMSLKCLRAYRRAHPEWKIGLSRKYRTIPYQIDLLLRQAAQLDRLFMASHTERETQQ